MSKKAICVCIGVLMSGLLCALPAEITGKVVSVIDGNTVEFQTADNETFKFALSGIDAPELSQEFGEEAKKLLEKLVVGEAATILIEGKDRLGNRVGSLVYGKNKDPRHELLEKGLAWTAEKNPRPEFETIKETAKSKEKGLWEQPNPIPPWIFRRQQTMLTAKSS
jgi:micrococcal nuclease